MTSLTSPPGNVQPGSPAHTGQAAASLPTSTRAARRCHRWLLLTLPFTLLLILYLAASLIVYNRLAAVAPLCAGQYADNTPARFSVGSFAPGMDTRPYWMPSYETVSIPSRDAGITLSGWYIPAQGPRTVLVVHGLGAAGAADCKRQPRALLPAGMLHQAGFNVLMIDLRQHGDSTVNDGMWAGGTKEYRDVLAAWDWLRTQKRIPPEHIGVYAYSGGTASTLYAMGDEPRVAAAWLDSPFADLGQAVNDRLWHDGYPLILLPGGLFMAQALHGDNLTGMSPLAEAPKIEGRPIFITHGDADNTLSVSYAYTLAGALGLPKDRLWIVPGVDHVRAAFAFPQEYARRLTGFFTQTLAG
jgi:dipeptidyl aminopeptidase/acylaminoacyl peptidase